jgi:hypothetical protein
MAAQNKKRKPEAKNSRIKNLRYAPPIWGTAVGVEVPWEDWLSPQAKAEILSTVLHELSCNLRKDFKKLPRKFQKLVHRTMRDCAIWHEDLSKKDLRNMREYWHDQRDISKP